MSAWRAISSALVLSLAALASASAGALGPATPQPTAESLNDGLAVTYYYDKFDHIDEMLQEIPRLKPYPGPPLPTLDYSTGPGKVLTSEGSNLVGAHISGFILFERPGDYALELISNDGVRLTLGGEMIFEDPVVHGDSSSGPIPVSVTTAGWYALDLLYFEKKGTSTLILRWKQPGDGEFAAVPASALKHARP